MIDIGQSGAIEVENGRATAIAVIACSLMYGWPLLIWPFVAIAHHLAVWAAVAYLVALTVLLVTFCYRASRIALLISDDGLVVRNLKRSWRVGWPQLAELVDGCSAGRWALTMLLTDRRAVTATGAAWTGGSVLGDPRTLRMLRDAAADHGVACNLTGVAAWRQRAWEDAAVSARWYKVRLGIWVPVAAGLLAGLVVVVAWNSEHTNYGPVFLPVGYAVVAAGTAAVAARVGWSRAMQPEPGRRAGCGVGDWFGMPLSHSRSAVGVIACEQNRGRGVVIGYFFAPFDTPQPTLDTIRELRPSRALLVAFFSASCIRLPGPGRGGSWPLLGRIDGWDRSAWPVPVFVRTDPRAEQSFRVYYDTELRLISEDSEPASPTEVAGLPAWRFLSQEMVVAELEGRLKAQ